MPRIGKNGQKFARCLLAQRTVWPILVVILTPVFNRLPRVVRACQNAKAGFADLAHLFHTRLSLYGSVGKGKGLVSFENPRSDVKNLYSTEIVLHKAY